MEVGQSGRVERGVVVREVVVLGAVMRGVRMPVAVVDDVEVDVEEDDGFLSPSL